MKTNLLRVLIGSCVLLIMLTACKKKDDDGNDDQKIDGWDLDKNPPPKFVNKNYIELGKIYRISRYRSSVGHDYSDFTEQCRSLKHYFEPLSTIDWSTLQILSPISGNVTKVEDEGTGMKVEIQSDLYPDFRVSIFHIKLSGPLKVGDHVGGGTVLGTHIGSQTYSDIAVMVNDTTHQGRLVSYFDIMTDSIFAEYVKFGIPSRDSLIIPKALRSANPLTCNGDQFSGIDPLPGWVLVIDTVKQDPVWDFDKNPLPKFVTANYIDLTNIWRISRYRSSIGHDYSDYTEQCRSMKHYFEPLESADWTTVKIYSPVTGEVVRVTKEWTGTKLEIVPDDFPASRFSIFHINLLNPAKAGDRVTAGQQLGTHVGTQTVSDIGIMVNDITKRGRMISFFDVLTDKVFDEYVKRGIPARDSLIIPKALRDANPLNCNTDGYFVGTDNLECWTYLK